MRKGFTRISAFICTLCLCFGMIGTVGAADIESEQDSRASDYLTYYDAWATTGAKGEVIISFDIGATRKVGFVGATNIIVQEKRGSSWYGVSTHFGSESNGLLITNADSHYGNIAYSGTSGKEYRASVTIYGGNDLTSGDYRTIITNTVTAK